MPVVDARILLGKVIDDSYELTSVLGQRVGSWSYVARDLSGGREVALRVLREQEEGNGNGSRAIQRLTTLDHTNLVPYERIWQAQVGHLSGIKQLSGTATLVVRNFAPVTLRTALNENNGMALEDKWGLLRAVLDALAYLHKENLVHGDLRPENIVWSPGGEFLLTDYSLPMDLPYPASARYRAPETSTSPPEPASDVYSFGALLRRLIPSLPGVASPQQSPDLVPIVAACLVANPSSRPTVETLQDVLFSGAQATSATTRRLLDAEQTLKLAEASFGQRHRGGHVRPSAIRNHLDAARARLRLQVETHPNLSIGLLDRHTIAHFIASLALLSLAGRDALVYPIEAVSEGETIGGRGGRRQTARPPGIDERWLAEVSSKYLGLPETELPQEYAFLPPADRERLAPSGKTLLENFTRELAVATRARAELLKNAKLLYVEEVRALLSVTAPGITDEEVRQMAAAGRLLAVKDYEDLLFPEFQFDEERGVPFEVVRYINVVLDSTTSPWGVLSWWYRPHQYFDGRSPRDALEEGRAVDDLLTAAEMSMGREPRERS